MTSPLKNNTCGIHSSAEECKKNISDIKAEFFGRNVTLILPEISDEEICSKLEMNKDKLFNASIILDNIQRDTNVIDIELVEACTPIRVIKKEIASLLNLTTSEIAIAQFATSKELKDKVNLVSHLNMTGLGGEQIHVRRL